ncbi:MAG: hypothetical protein V3U76_02085 [Granulosicoccus sp.]
MNHQIAEGRFLTPTGWLSGRCAHDSHVHKLEMDKSIDSSISYLPAPVDLHIHGGGGFDAMQGDDALREMLCSLAATGTGAALATSVTADTASISEFIASAQRVMADQPTKGATLLGVHLEGPFINPDKLGAQPAYATPLDIKQLEAWLATDIVRVITYAPEIDPEQKVPALCKRYGTRAQLGHTLCSWAEAKNALIAGCGVTHLFNAMSGFDHRGGGAAVAALAYANHAEIITDGVHVDRAAFEAARRSVSGLYSVTDATAAAGMADGDYQLGGLTVRKQGDRVLLPDGTLAGSCLTQQQSVRVLRGWDLDWEAIARLNSSVPANWIEAREFGRIVVGARAHWLEIRHEQAVALWLDGQRLAF